MSKAAADQIRKIHQLFKGLDVVAAEFDKLAAMDQHKSEHETFVAKAKADVADALAAFSKAKEDAVVVTSKAKEQADRIVADAQGTAAAIKAKAEEIAKAATDSVAAKGKELEAVNAKLKEASDALASLLTRVADAEKAEAAARARIEKIKADLLKQMG